LLQRICYQIAMYIESVPNRQSPPAILLRESYREGGKVKKRTLLNLSNWPSDRITGFKMLLKGGTVWLAVRQPAIEMALAKYHLSGGTLVLYDVSSSYLEGRCCPLAQFGYNRDRKRGKLQIVYGLLCAPNGCPVAIEVFEGSTSDPTTLTSDQAQRTLRSRPRRAGRRSRHEYPGAHH
jgi:hypothetical protein